MLLIRNLSVCLEENHVLQSIDLHVDSGEIVCLLGPSGCGKTTLLRTVAGLETIQSGEIYISGEDQKGVPVYRRQIGLMFQDLALFPHMNVAQNVDFGLRMRHMTAERRCERVQDVLQLVGLRGFDGRDVGSLSGGEQQRVSLARSIAPNPRLLMLDEPLSSLDTGLRERLIGDLHQIIKSVQLATIYVTHAQEEAFTIADRIVVMNAGYIEQIDTPEALYWRPKSKFVAQFLGFENIIEAERLRHYLHLDTEDGPLSVGRDHSTVLLHPDKLQIGTHNTYCISGKMVNQRFKGRAIRLEICIDETIVLRFETPHKIDEQDVQITFDHDAIIPLPD